MPRFDRRCSLFRSIMPLCSMLYITTVIFGRVSGVRCGILGNRGYGMVSWVWASTFSLLGIGIFI